jgi:hypothetical protein
MNSAASLSVNSRQLNRLLQMTRRSRRRASSLARHRHAPGPGEAGFVAPSKSEEMTMNRLCEPFSPCACLRPAAGSTRAVRSRRLPMISGRPSSTADRRPAAGPSVALEIRAPYLVRLARLSSIACSTKTRSNCAATLTSRWAACAGHSRSHSGCGSNWAFSGARVTGHLAAVVCCASKLQEFSQVFAYAAAEQPRCVARAMPTLLDTRQRTPRRVAGAASRADRLPTGRRARRRHCAGCSQRRTRAGSSLAG